VIGEVLRREFAAAVRLSEAVERLTPRVTRERAVGGFDRRRLEGVGHQGELCAAGVGGQERADPIGVPFVLIRGYRFGVRTHEPRFEPMHVHVLGRSGEAKFWLRPVRLEMSTYNRAVTKQIQRIVRQRESTFISMWGEIHGDD
jgi:hypothetical protein